MHMQTETQAHTRMFGGLLLVDQTVLPKTENKKKKKKKKREEKVILSQILKSMLLPGVNVKTNSTHSKLNYTNWPSQNAFSPVVWKDQHFRCCSQKRIFSIKMLHWFYIQLRRWVSLSDADSSGVYSTLKRQPAWHRTLWCIYSQPWAVFTHKPCESRQFSTKTNKKLKRQKLFHKFNIKPTRFCFCFFKLRC